MSIYHSPQNSGYGQPTSSDGLPLIQKCLQSRGISQTTQDTILSSWWTATQKHNQVYLEKWQSCADGKAVNPLNPPVRDVMEFLQEGFSLLDSFSHAILSAAVKTHCPFTSLSGQFLFC